jgi:hypothetical protein
LIAVGAVLVATGDPILDVGLRVAFGGSFVIVATVCAASFELLTLGFSDYGTAFRAALVGIGWRGGGFIALMTLLVR